MTEKYTSAGKFAAARARRGVQRAVLAPLVRWTAGAPDRDGYTVIVACNSRMAPMIDANLTMLSRQDLEGVDAVVVVVDRAEGEMPEGFAADLRGRFPTLPLRVEFYNRRQSRVARAFDWGWVYSWMSWSIGINSARTRYALLHDFDAMLLRRDVLRRRYEAIRERGVEYLGVRYYAGGGIVPDDRLVTTFELMFDAEHVRRRLRPIDLFNNVRRFKGRRVEFDTFLHAQSVTGRTDVLPIDEEWMVHPSQMICQYVEHVNGRPVPRGTNNLLMIPYFYYLGGDGREMREVAGQLGETPGRPQVRVFGREVDVSALTAAHARWLSKQSERLERELFGGVRPEVRAYFDAIAARCAGEVAVP